MLHWRYFYLWSNLIGTAIHFLFLWMCVSLCVSNLCAGACGGKKRAPYALNLELNVVMSSLTCMLGAKLRALERTASSLNHSTISQTKDIKILFLPPPNLNILGDQEKDKALLCLLIISGRKKIKNSSNKFSSQEVCDFFFGLFLVLLPSLQHQRWGPNPPWAFIVNPGSWKLSTSELDPQSQNPDVIEGQITTFI